MRAEANMGQPGVMQCFDPSNFEIACNRSISLFEWFLPFPAFSRSNLKNLNSGFQSIV